MELPVENILNTSPQAPAGACIGLSREGRKLHGFAAGTGNVSISLIGGCHADEPVGPWMLDRLTTWLASRPSDHPVLTRFTWRIIPHMNPDGEANNDSWTRITGDLVDPATYAENVVRELPGEDLEFGFPRDAGDNEARPEALAAAQFLSTAAPFDLHISFHGLAAGKGPWFLIEPAWADRCTTLMDHLAEATTRMGYGLHDDQRTGEKGFRRLRLGFSTRPDSHAMREFFLKQGDPDTAGLFRPSSMEWVRAQGGDPLTMVSEMPLFVIRPQSADKSARECFNELIQAWAAGKSIPQDNMPIRPMPVRDQQRLQLMMLQEGINTCLMYEV